MRYLTKLLIGFPLLLLAYLYATWCAGYLALGYWPRPMLDDPKYIGSGLVEFCFVVTYLLAGLGIPLFCLAVVPLTTVYLVVRPKDWKKRTLDLGIAMALFASVILFIRWDPLRVLEWYLD